MAYRILIVDDEPEMVQMLSRFLSRSGYEIIPAFTGEEAVASIKAHPSLSAILPMAAAISSEHRKGMYWAVFGTFFTLLLKFSPPELVTQSEHKKRVGEHKEKG